MERPFAAYDGDEPFVFVCYAHDDQGVVYPELVWLKDAGVNIWYDEGISPGAEWSDEIADGITGCGTFVYFISPQAIASEHCRRELNFALSHNVKVQAVHLEPTTIERGLALSLGNRQAILKHELGDARYRERLVEALAPGAQVPAPEPAAATHSPSRIKPLAIWAAAGLALVLVGAWLFDRAEQETAPAISGKTDVFLRPVRDLSTPPAPRFAAGLTDEILAILRKVPGWRPHLASEEVEASSGYVVESSVRLNEASVRLSVNVSAASTDEVLESLTTDDLRLEDLRSQERLAMVAGNVTHETIETQRLQRESLARTGRNDVVDMVQVASTKLPYDHEACGRAIQLDPGLAEAHLCLAAALLLSPDPDHNAQGLKALAHAESVAPGHAQVLVTRALTPLSSTKDYPQAESLLLMAREVDPFSAGMLNSLGWVLFVTGRIDEAFDIYQRIMPMVRDRDLYASITAGYQYQVIAWTTARFAQFIRETDFDNPFLADVNRQQRSLFFAELEDPRAGPLIDEYDLRWEDLRPRQKARAALGLQRIGRLDQAAARYAELNALIESGAMYQPNDPMTWVAWGMTHYAVAAGDFDAAFRSLELARSNDPDFVLLVASLAYTRNPRYATLREDPRFDEVFAQSREPRKMHEK
jgi:tetratricopeptide (TPR) repeat protein